MTAIDFPNTPTNGQVFTSGERTWTWNSSENVWESVSAAESIDYTSTDSVLSGQVFE